MNMPTRYIFAESHTMPAKEAYSKAKDVHICQAGMPNGMRAIITIGEVKGIIDVQTASEDAGFCTTDILTTMPIMIGMTAMLTSWDASWMLSTAEPTAA